MHSHTTAPQATWPWAEGDILPRHKIALEPSDLIQDMPISKGGYIAKYTFSGTISYTPIILSFYPDHVLRLIKLVP